MNVRVYIFYSQCITRLLNPHPCKEPKICILMRCTFVRAGVCENYLVKDYAKPRGSGVIADPIAAYKLECSIFGYPDFRSFEKISFFIHLIFFDVLFVILSLHHILLYMYI